MIADDHASDTGMAAELVAALYVTPGTILFASVTVTVVMIAAGLLSGGDFAFYGIAAANAAIGGFRQQSFRRYRSIRLASASPIDIRMLEIRAMLGAWATAAVFSLFGCYAVLRYTHQPVAVLAIAQTIGYLAGISGRNGSRPLIQYGQMLIAATPFTLALLWTREPVNLVIAVSVVLATVVSFSSARVIHRMFLARLRTMRELEYLAANDVVTGLHNRRGFLHEIRAMAEGPRPVTLISIDVDRFKAINDSFGHDVGDGLLKAVSQTLTTELGPRDIAARTGGDEFMVATTRELEDAEALAARLVMLIASPRVIGGRHVTATASMGVAPANRAPSIEDALKCVDIALFRAKLDGRNRFVTYTPEIQKEHEEGIALEVELRDAIRRGEFELNFQPIYDPHSGQVMLVEALLRWNHPQRGRVSPQIFIPLAEQTGMITSLGSWALGEAIRAALAWPSAIGVSVNVSARQFDEGDEGDDLVRIVESLLRETGLESQRLTIEITESSLIHDTGGVVARLAALRRLGVRIALDDFGTGYSSLSYLVQLPIDTIKIDQSLARELGNSAKAGSLMKAITQLARDLKLRLIVEGVETQEQMALIERHGVDGVQGFVLARPMTAAELLPVIGGSGTAARATRKRKPSPSP